MEQQKGLVGLPTDKKRTALGTITYLKAVLSFWMISTIRTRSVLSSL